MKKFALAICILSSTATLGCNTNPTQGKAQATVGDVPSAPAAAPAAAAPPAALLDLPINAKSGSVAFVGAKISAKHPGKFSDFSGKVSLSPNTPEQSKVEMTIPVSSMVIEPEKLRGHLLSADFFDAEKFPTATFSSTKIEKSGEGYLVTGNLTLHGVTKSISFPANITAGTDSATVKAEFGINRKDFGIVYPGMPDDLIQDQVLIQIDLKAQKA
jgi:polyisoprenoid-binding protein YceI